MRLTARSIRLRMPPEYDFTGRSATSVIENCSSSWSPSRVTSRRPMPYSAPIIRMFSRPVSSSSTVAGPCPVSPMLLRTMAGSASTS